MKSIKPLEEIEFQGADDDDDDDMMMRGAQRER